MLFPQGDRVMADLWNQHHSEACNEATYGRSINAMQPGSSVFSLSPSKQVKQEVSRAFCFESTCLENPVRLTVSITTIILRF